MANSQINHYLEIMEGRLKQLSPAQRQEEIQEIRQHLEALVAGHRMAGLSEEEAEKAAIRQFGHAEQVGQELSNVSQRQRMRVLFLPLVYFLTVAVLMVFFIVNDSPDTWFAKIVMAISLPAGVLALGVAEMIQIYLRSRNKQNHA
jgi:uncharacterized integral membrane protein